MDIKLLKPTTKLRLCVGYLGEKDQFAWWQSSFFTEGSNAFLSPLFSRTQVLAQCNGVTRAAALIHDESIGVGHVYHLFRLPEDMEQGIHQTLLDAGVERIVQSVTVSSEATLEHIERSIAENEPSGEGPIRVGKVSDMQNKEYWKIVAGYYQFAFQENLRIYPYFSNIS